MKKFNKCQISKFEMDLKQFNFALPKTDKELINISISVMSGFINYLKKDKFVMDSKKNLDLMRTTNKNIYDIMNLSISLSEIATAIE